MKQCKLRSDKIPGIETGLRGGTDIAADCNSLVIRPLKQPRQGWTESFQEMARRGDDVVLDIVAPTLSAWDEDEWVWR
jgi:antitoxin MazE